MDLFFRPATTPKFHRRLFPSTVEKPPRDPSPASDTRDPARSSDGSSPIARPPPPGLRHSAALASAAAHAAHANEGRSAGASGRR